MNPSYLRKLDAQLRSVGIGARRRRRILVEVREHLRDSGNVDAFGSPSDLAQQFADELGTRGSVRASAAVFLALVGAGAVYVAAFLPVGTSPDIFSARTPWLGVAAAATMVLAPQVALAAGLLVLLHLLRIRGAAVAAAADVQLLQRRAAIAAGAAACALGALALYAYEYAVGLPAWWQAMAYAGSACAVVALVAAGILLVRAARIRVQQPGRAGDVFDDLAAVLALVPSRRDISGPGAVMSLRDHPWVLCVLVASLAASAGLAGGIVGGQPDEGVRNALGELVAVVAGFVALGRPLAIRPYRRAS